MEDLSKNVNLSTTGTQWSLRSIASKTPSHMQRKTSRLERNAAYVGLKMSAKKTNVMRINARKESIKISGSEIQTNLPT